METINPPLSLQPLSIEEIDADESFYFVKNDSSSGTVNRSKKRVLCMIVLFIVFIVSLMCALFNPNNNTNISTNNANIDNEEVGPDNTKNYGKSSKIKFSVEDFRTWLNNNDQNSNNPHPFGPLKNISFSRFPIFRPPTEVTVTPAKKKTSKNTSNNNDNDNDSETITSSTQYTVVGSIPFDKQSFTQGLTYGNGKLYVSTGLYGKSKIRQLNKTDGSIIENFDLSNEYFGEGLTLFNNNTNLIQLTWKKKLGFIYSIEPQITIIKTFSFTTTRNQGWGITYDSLNKQFIVSDGSEYLHFWNEDTLQETHKVAVVTNDNTTTIPNINELEYINGRILANVWYQDKILIINPISGVVEQDIDFTALWSKSVRKHAGADVLNGISIFENGEILMTGKLWPKLYRIKLNDFVV